VYVGGFKGYPSCGAFPDGSADFFALRAAARNVNRSPLLCVNEKKFVILRSEKRGLYPLPRFHGFNEHKTASPTEFNKEDEKPGHSRVARKGENHREIPGP
jgi:hypothetical protein